MNWKSLKEVLETANNIPANPEEWPNDWKTIYYKTYERSCKYKPSTLIDLDNIPLTHLLETRGSAKSFKGSISLNEIFSIFYYAAKENDQESGSRTYPSGGGRYPLELYYINTKKQNDFPIGLYHFNQVTRDFSLIKKAEELDILTILGIKQNLANTASGGIIFTYLPHRNIPKYGWLGLRLALMETGILGQNISLVAQSMAIKTRFLGYINTKNVNSLLEIDGLSETSFVAMLIGK